MKFAVTQVCIGRLHHFDLARELAIRGHLKRFYTGYPSWKIRDQRIPLQLVTTFPWVMTPYMALGKWVKGSHTWLSSIFRIAQTSLDAYVAATLPDCDVLLALSGSGLKSGQVAKRRGIPFVCDRGSVHIREQDSILREEFARWGHIYSGIDPKMIARHEGEYETADFITVPSAFALDSFVRMGVPRRKLIKVPYGVDLRSFHKVAEPGTRTFDVLFVGQASFRKGVPYLLAAFARLRHPKKRLRIIGRIQPEVREYLRTESHNGDVEFLGHLPQAVLKQYMSSSHVMVLPSVEEGLALVLAQALACGCPVIATHNTGATDLFTDDVEGFIVAPRDTDALTDRLQLLAEDAARRNQMSAAALRRVAKLSGWGTYGDRMEAALEQVIVSNRSVPPPAL